MSILKKSKRAWAMDLEFAAWAGLAVLAAIIVLIMFLILSGKGTSAIEYAKSIIFRGRA